MLSTVALCFFEHILSIAIGIVLVIVGILGLLLPIVPGVLLILLGLLCLGFSPAKRLFKSFKHGKK